MNNFIKIRPLFLSKITEQIKNNASLGIKRTFKNKGQYNAFVSNQQRFLGFFYIVVFYLSKDYFKSYDLRKKTTFKSKQKYVFATVVSNKI